MTDNCWCGMDHSKVEMDSEGNWVEVQVEEEDR